LFTAHKILIPTKLYFVLRDKEVLVAFGKLHKRKHLGFLCGSYAQGNLSGSQECEVDARLERRTFMKTNPHTQKAKELLSGGKKSREDHPNHVQESFEVIIVLFSKRERSSHTTNSHYEKGRLVQKSEYQWKNVH